MSSKRRRFSGELKAKVALEALRGDRTLQEIASQHQVHPNQVSVPTIGAGLVAVARRHLEVVAAGEGEDHLVRAGPHRRLDHRFRVGLGRQAGDVLRHRALEQHHLLGQPAQMARKVRLAVLVERRAAERRLAAHRRPHPGERLGERRLARGRRPGDPDGMAGIEAAIMIPGVTSPRIASQAPSPSIIDCRNSLSVREVKVGAGIIALFLAWFWYRGVQLGRRKRIRGAELVTAAELRRRVRPLHLRALDRAPGGKRLRPYSIAGIPYPERTETLDWVEKNVAETRMKDPGTGQMVRAGGQKIVAATFRHDTSRNLDPQLHTHSVVANMVRGEDDKWRSMANEKLYGSKMLLGALYRNELAASLTRLGYDIEKTHADGRFEIAGGLARDDRDVLDAARRDRGGDGRTRARHVGGQPPPCRTRLADDAGEEARHRPGRTPRRLGTAGRRSRPRRQGAGCRGGREIVRADTGSGARGGGTCNGAGQGPGNGGSGARRYRRAGTWC